TRAAARWRPEACPGARRSALNSPAVERRFALPCPAFTVTSDNGQRVAGRTAKTSGPPSRPEVSGCHSRLPVCAIAPEVPHFLMLPLWARASSDAHQRLRGDDARRGLHAGILGLADPVADAEKPGQEVRSRAATTPPGPA